MRATTEIINTKQLRAELLRVVHQVSDGKRFLVLYRSKPAFQITSIEKVDSPLPPLEDDPVFQMPPSGRSEDGHSAAEHDAILYSR